MKKYLTLALLGLALSAVALTAAATPGNGQGNGNGHGLSGWTANVQGNSSSSTTGGSQAETSAQGNGFAANVTYTNGGGRSAAFGSYSPQGVETGTQVSSHSGGFSGSVKAGRATSQAASGVGTDVNANAWGSFKAGGFGGWQGW